jgi:hypothetical protein
MVKLQHGDVPKSTYELVFQKVRTLFDTPWGYGKGVLEDFARICFGEPMRREGSLERLQKSKLVESDGSILPDIRAIVLDSLVFQGVGCDRKLHCLQSSLVPVTEITLDRAALSALLGERIRAQSRKMH